MRRIKRESGKDSFELIPEKVGKLHDDRAYTYGMLAHWLHEKRMSNIRIRKKPNNENLVGMFTMTKAKQPNKMFG